MTEWNAHDEFHSCCANKLPPVHYQNLRSSPFPDMQVCNLKFSRITFISFRNQKCIKFTPLSCSITFYNSINISKNKYFLFKKNLYLKHAFS